MATTAKTASPKTSAKKEAAVKKSPEKKLAAPKKAAAAKKPKAISAEERYRMTEVAAYFIAERNGFAGSPSDYWIAAEKQISDLLAK